MNASVPLRFASSVGARAALTATVKRLAAEHGLTVAAVTSAEPFAELEDRMLDHIAQGRVAGLDWFTAERARFSLDPRNLQATARSILASRTTACRAAASPATRGASITTTC